MATLRGLRRLALRSAAPLCTAAALLLACAADASAADRVTLKDGQVLEGVVEDRGEHVLVHRPIEGGGEITVRLDRREILRIDLDPSLSRSRRPTDVVQLFDGEEIEGRVALRDGGQRVAIARGSGEVVIERSRVRRILWAAAQASSPHAPTSVAQVLETTLGRLQSEQPAERAAARKRLFAIGALVLPYLEARKDDADLPPVVRGTIEEAIRAARLEIVLPALLRERLPGLPRRLIDPDPEVRTAALRQAIAIAGKKTAPLLLRLAQTDDNPKVRAFCLGQLRMIGDTDALLVLLDSRDPTLRFAAAVALGDLGIYAGVPLLIEGLRHEALEVRKLSIEKLEAWTGQFLGYFPDDPPDKRAAAIERWERWYAERGKAFVDASLRATIDQARVSDEDKETGRALWIAAQKLWDRVRQEQPTGEERQRRLTAVRYQLERALARYPQFTRARLALAELLYTELGERKAARRELEQLLERYVPDDDRHTRYLAELHLARIARLDNEPLEAEKHYRLARSALRGGIEAATELAELLAAEALAPGTHHTPAERQALLRKAIDAYSDALTVLATDLREIGRSRKEADRDFDRAAPFERGRTLRRLSELEANKRAEMAALLYARARCHAALGDDKRAATDAAAAAQLDPANPRYRRAAQIWGVEPAPEARAARSPTATARPR